MDAKNLTHGAQDVSLLVRTLVRGACSRPRTSSRYVLTTCGRKRPLSRGELLWELSTPSGPPSLPDGFRAPSSSPLFLNRRKGHTGLSPSADQASRGSEPWLQGAPHLLLAWPMPLAGDSGGRGTLAVPQACWGERSKSLPSCALSAVSVRKGFSFFSRPFPRTTTKDK